MSAKGRILYVDDSPLLLAATREKLTAAGYHVATASTLAAACQLVPKSDIALIDYHLDGTTGVQALEALKAALPDASACRFILYTSDKSKAAAYKKLGFDACFAIKGDMAALLRQLEASMRVLQIKRTLKDTLR